MPSKGGFKLNEKENRDVEILLYLYQFRRLVIDHVVMLTGREKTRVNRRLARLTEHKYVYRQRQHSDQKYVYTIRQRALPILVKHKLIPEEVLDRQIRWHERTDYFREHNIGVTDFHVCLELASRKSPIKLVHWGEGKEIEDKISVYVDGRQRKLSIKPDGFFTLEDTRRPEGRNLADFFFEYDRFSSTQKRWKDKVDRYKLYFEKGLHTKKYGIKGAKVVTIGLDAERARKRCEATSEVIPTNDQRLYYFAAEQEISFNNPERVFEDIFLTPRDLGTDRRYSFFPPLDK